MVIVGTHAKPALEGRERVATGAPTLLRAIQTIVYVPQPLKEILAKVFDIGAPPGTDVIVADDPAGAMIAHVSEAAEAGAFPR